jgi:putative oxidoreductase
VSKVSGTIGIMRGDIDMEAILLAARLLLGLGMAAHGAQKLFGWFGGYGLKGTGGFFEGLGFKPGTLFALAAGLGEFGGGMLVALGLGGPVGPALVIIVMLVAIFTVHWGHGFFVQSNGVEVPVLYISGMLLLMFAGSGPYSIDALAGLNVWPASAKWIALGVAALLAIVNLVLRRARPQTAG